MGLESAESSLFLIGLENVFKAKDTEREGEKTLLCITTTLAQR